MDYLEHYRQKAAFKKISLAGVSCKHAATTLKSVRSDWDNNRLVPEGEAIAFYLGNHAFSLLPQRYSPYEPLGAAADIAEEYTDTLMKSGVKLFYYLLLICTRESRHAGNGDDFYEDLQNTHGSTCVTFLKSIRGAGSSSAVDEFIYQPPQVDLAKYSDFLVNVFVAGLFTDGYGGEAWADIARCLSNYCNGRTSLEMMVDTAWTLCHNNGPMFNKGIIFEHHNEYQIKTILDVQRSGQMPQYVEDGPQYNAYYVKDHHSTFQSQVKQLFPDFGGHIDWFSVEILGAVQDYDGYKATQVEAHGQPTGIEALKKAQEKKAALVDADKFYITNKEAIQKLTREEYHAAA